VAEWRKIPEAGTVLGLRFITFLARVFGRRIAGWCLFFPALYFTLLRGVARRASRDYLRRVGQRATFANIVRHIHTFAVVTLDRLFFLTGRWDRFRIEANNHDLLADIARTKRGVLLLGAHIGSFEVMRSRAKEFNIPINVVVDWTNAERLNGVLRSLAPGIDTRLIPLGPDTVTAMLSIQAAIDRGELVALLGDRRPADESNPRMVTTDFLGAKAAFPAGPWLLAHALHCPVYFVAAMYQRPNRYALHFDLLAEEVKLDRKDRANALARYAGIYAAKLETYVRSAPLNWFNFFDFWGTS
jgi:predicted LPLAT superfamily acyltransferase